MQAKSDENDENTKTDDAFDNSDLQSLEAIAILLLREVELLEKKQFLNDDALLREKIRLHEEVEKFEINLIRQALVKANGKQTLAAELLGIKLTTLNVKIKRFKIDIDKLLVEPQ